MLSSLTQRYQIGLESYFILAIAISLLHTFINLLCNTLTWWNNAWLLDISSRLGHERRDNGNHSAEVPGAGERTASYQWRRFKWLSYSCLSSRQHRVLIGSTCLYTYLYTCILNNYWIKTCRTKILKTLPANITWYWNLQICFTVNVIPDY